MIYLDAVRNLRVEGSNVQVLDIGAGSGKMSRHFAELGYHVDAIDIRDVLVPADTIRFQKISFQDFIPEKKYDIIYAHNVFFFDSNPIAYAEKYAHFLKPNGIFCLTLMGEDDPWADTTTETKRGTIKLAATKESEVLEFQKNFKVLFYKNYKGTNTSKENISKEWHLYKMILQTN